MSLNEKMTALADEVRELSSTTTSKSLDAMISDVGDANTEISSQEDLIAQITTALAGKVAGGSSNLETVTVTINAPIVTVNYFSEYGYRISGEASLGTPYTCIKNSLFICQLGSSSTSLVIEGAGVVLEADDMKVLELYHDTTITESSSEPDKPLPPGAFG